MFHLKLILIFQYLKALHVGLLRAVAIRTFSLQSDVEKIHIDAVCRNTLTFYQSNK